MIKKTLIYFILILFSTNVAAAELIMKCGDYTYKYIEDSAGDRVDYKHPKGTKNKYVLILRMKFQKNFSFHKALLSIRLEFKW